MEKSYFCQQICCLLCCEYWIMVTQTTDSKKRGWETLCFIYFFTNWIFPFGKHETSLGILRVKPELFSSFLSFSSHFSSRFFIYIIQTKLSFFPPFIPSMMIKSIHKRAEREVSSRVEKQFKETQPESNIYWRHYPERKVRAIFFRIFNISRQTLKRFQIVFHPQKKTWKWNSKNETKKSF